MLPDLLFKIVTTTADFVIFVFVAYYFLILRTKEKTLDKKGSKIDTEYHQIVDDALTKERKILEDATSEASQILTDAKYINETSKETVNDALQKMSAESQKEITDIQKETVEKIHEFTNSYQASLKEVMNASLSDFQKIAKDMQSELQQQQKSLLEETANFNTAHQTSLKQLSSSSLTEFQTIVKGMEQDLQKQIKEFHDAMLPALKKELEEYKAMRLKQAEQTITKVIQEVSQEVFNKSLSLEDHQKLLINSLEQAKKEKMLE